MERVQGRPRVGHRPSASPALLHIHRGVASAPPRQRTVAPAHHNRRYHQRNAVSSAVAIAVAVAASTSPPSPTPPPPPQSLAAVTVGASRPQRSLHRQLPPDPRESKLQFRTQLLGVFSFFLAAGAARRMSGADGRTGSRGSRGGGRGTGRGKSKVDATTYHGVPRARTKMAAVAADSGPPFGGGPLSGGRPDASEAVQSRVPHATTKTATSPPQACGAAHGEAPVGRL